jgi:UDP-N-acetylmuramyl tripeptide synthase
VELTLPGLYNVYNAAAATSLALALGASPAAVRKGLQGFSAAFGRFERIPAGAKAIVILLIKNPAAANEALRTLETGVPPVLVVALNDAIADGQDVSWIWDVDFEPILPHVGRVVATGGRAAELGLRFVHGGLPEDRLEVEPELERALDRGLALVEAGTELVVLPTYTAMLALRGILTDRGLVKPYWDGTPP